MLMWVIYFVVLISAKSFSILLLDDHYGSRLLGSVQADENAFPYTVNYLIGALGICGGALISSEHILTSASCLEGQTAVFVCIGAHDRTLLEPGQYRELVTQDRFIIHENWTVATYENNIAILVLNGNFEMTEKIQSIGLPSRSFLEKAFQDFNFIASGWGYAGGTHETESFLHYMNASLLPNAICRHFYAPSFTLDNICIDGSFGHSGCDGDAGGPLVLAPEVEDQNQFSSNWILVGIQSLVPQLGCEERWPTLYTRVSSYLDWIEEKTAISIED
ncbi:brachyurin-like [Hermetia illucens]|nr:brachyurin-like [Hermetia illucens]